MGCHGEVCSESSIVVGWKDLLQKPNETIALPWVGGRELRSATRTWNIAGALPAEHGWRTFELQGRTAVTKLEAEPAPYQLDHMVLGYLVGDRLVPDDSRVDPDPRKIATCSERVHLLESGLDRFARVRAGRVFEGGPLIYKDVDLPFGIEDAVLQAYLDRVPSLDAIKGVSPALDAAFRLESLLREETEKRRAEALVRAQEEQERLEKEALRQELEKSLGDGAGRRALAAIDFDAAVAAALAIGGAELLDTRWIGRNEAAVRFRLEGRRFECTCDRSLHIISSGICLTVGDEVGDSRFTLESICSVILEAIRTDQLVVRRHV